MVALWCAFAATLGASLRWLDGPRWICAAVGLIAGPLAYLGGEGLGALVIEAPRTPALLAIGLGWGLATPLLFAIRGWSGAPPTAYTRRQPED